MFNRNTPKLRARILQSTALVILSAMPQVSIAQSQMCDDTVLPIPVGCDRFTGGSVVSTDIGPNTEIDVAGDLGAGGFSISLDNRAIAGAPPISNAQRTADLRLARNDVDVTFDGLDNRRLLNVGTADQSASYRAGETVTFRSSSNYPAYLARAEVQITDQSRRGSPVVATLPVNPNGSVNWVMPSDGEGQYAYTLKVYDAAGRADETQPLGLVRSNQNSDPTALAPFVVAGEGEDRTRVRRIPVQGGSVTVSGTSAPRGTVRIMGEDVPVDANGRYAVSRILPPGDHVVDVQTIQGVVRRDVNIPASDWFYVGVADVTLGLRAGGAREIEESYANGRLAFYVKGQTASGYRVTASLDTRDGPIEDIFTRLNDKDTRRVLDRLRTAGEDVYPTYGDDSTSFDDTPTSGSIYVRVESDTTKFTFGNFTAGINGPGLLNNSRDLYGAELQYQSSSVTENGDARFTGVVYGAQQDTVGQSDVLRGTGGSTYFLSRQDITGGSVRISVQTRDPLTGFVVDQRELVEGVDFSVDYIQGVLILAQPLNSASSDGGIISDGAGEFDVNLIAQYEYTPTTALSDATAFGGRAEVWATNELRFGVTAMNERVNDDTQNMYGVDLRYQASENSFLDVEVAVTDGPGIGRSTSTDGGLTIAASGGAAADQAQAVRLRGQLDLAELGFARDGYISGYFEQKDAGFSTINETITDDQTLIGAEAEVALTDRIALAFSAEQFETDAGTEKTEVEVEVGYKLNDAWTVEAAASLLDKTTVGSAEETGERTDVGLRLTYAPDDDLSVYVFGQATVSNEGGLSDNNRYGVGFTSQVSEKLNLSGEVSDGDTGVGAAAQLSYAVTDTNEVYMGYTLDPTRTGAGSRLSDNGTLVVGGRAQLTDTISTFAETVLDAPGNQRSMSQAYGVSYTPTDAWTYAGSMETGRVRDAVDGDFDRLALSFGMAYAPSEDLSMRARLEYRTEDGEGTSRDRDTWGLSAGYANQVAEDWRLMADLEALFSESAEGDFRDGEYGRLTVGYAYRPIDNERLNVLFSYTALTDQPGEDQISANGNDEGLHQRSQILSAAASYDINQALTLGGKLGYRMAQVAPRGTNDWTDNTATLAALRLDWHAIQMWDIMGEGRALYTAETGTLERGAMVGVYRHMGENLKVGVGYEWGDVSDDAADINYDSQGLFLNIVGKF